jgi:hypothetical protein
MRLAREAFVGMRHSRRGRLRWISAMLLVLGGVSTAAEAKAASDPASPASAETAVARADRLFQEAQSLATAGACEKALPLFEESQRLDPAIGTQYAIAECDEKLGRDVRAFRAYVQIERRAHEAGKPKLERLAHDRVQALAPRVPRLRVALAEADLDAVITIDGQAASRATPIVVEPGEHAVRVLASGRLARELRAVAEPSRTVDVRVPRLEALPSGPQRPDPVGRRRLGVALGATGAGVVVAGGVFGGIALSQRADAAAGCEDRTRCANQAQADAWSSASSAGNVSTVLLVGGLVLVAAGATLYFASPKPAARAMATLATLAGGAPLAW